MDKKYQQLLSAIARSVEILAEKAMELHHKEGDHKGFETASEMRNKYSRLHDLLEKEQVKLSREDFITLYIGAGLVIKQIEGKIHRDRLALKGYQTDLIPKLEEIVNYKGENFLEKVAEIFSINS